MLSSPGSGGHRHTCEARVLAVTGGGWGAAARGYKAAGTTRSVSHPQARGGKRAGPAPLRAFLLPRGGQGCQVPGVPGGLSTEGRGPHAGPVPVPNPRGPSGSSAGDTAASPPWGLRAAGPQVVLEAGWGQGHIRARLSHLCLSRLPLKPPRLPSAPRPRPSPCAPSP